jgi:hypothetical protein
LVEAQRRPKIAVHHAFPVVQVLLPEGNVEAVGMTCGSNVSDRSAFTQHLQDRIARHKMDQQEDDRDHQPEDWQCVKQSGK